MTHWQRTQGWTTGRLAAFGPLWWGLKSQLRAGTGDGDPHPELPSGLLRWPCGAQLHLQGRHAQPGSRGAASTRCGAEDATRAAGAHRLCRPPGVSVSWFRGDTLQGRAEAWPTAPATAACTSHTKNSRVRFNISIPCRHFKIKSFSFKVKNTRLFVTVK